MTAARDREVGNSAGRSTGPSGNLLLCRCRRRSGAGEICELNLVDDVVKALAEDVVFFGGGFFVSAAFDDAFSEFHANDEDVTVFHEEEVAALGDRDAVGGVELRNFVGEHRATGDENVSNQRALERAGDKFRALNLHALEGLFEIGEDEVAKK